MDEKNVKTPIHSLNLSDVYIITSDNTASASESVINGLKPYINVVTVGTATYGKYVGS
ncbi:MAG: peptidase S41, partial [Bacteroidetes bacterium]|nr:peptidase S41 [Bacteroidota bacterium]